MPDPGCALLCLLSGSSVLLAGTGAGERLPTLHPHPRTQGTKAFGRAAPGTVLSECLIRGTMLLLMLTRPEGACGREKQARVS